MPGWHLVFRIVNRADDGRSSDEVARDIDLTLEGAVLPDYAPTRWPLERRAGDAFHVMVWFGGSFRLHVDERYRLIGGEEASLSFVVPWDSSSGSLELAVPVARR